MENFRAITTESGPLGKISSGMSHIQESFFLFHSPRHGIRKENKCQVLYEDNELLKRKTHQNQTVTICKITMPFTDVLSVFDETRENLQSTWPDYFCQSCNEAEKPATATMDNLPGR
ncbi:hypothetical protein CEXT_543031 [Caerostris extrusa]|uniref:Uncharacterized protein n=1 Tax=Caerostris extrusa TaxID=172846 RepID=A0AAV4Q1M5_CAEEX|nr:hypothetical protein CEXT_543031 [Caerostris extrusa]